MGSDANGIQNSPFSQAWATPGVGGEGANGIGGGIDTSGTNGITNSPFDKAQCPTPGGEETACPELGQPEPMFSRVTDDQAPGSTVQPWDITSSRNTVDRR